MFLCELFMTPCLAYKTKSSDTIWNAIKNKLSTCSYITMYTSCLNQTGQSERSFTSFVLMSDLNSWTVSESECASVYCIQCKQDSGSDCNFCYANDPAWMTSPCTSDPKQAVFWRLLHKCFFIDDDFKL